MKNLSKILIALVIGILITFSVSVSARPTSPGQGSPTTPGALCKTDGDTWALCDSSDTFGDSTDPISDIYTTDLTVAGAFTLSGTVSGTLDMNGNKIDLDADADTSITADTDDQIDIEIAGADDFQFVANEFVALSGSDMSLDDNGHFYFDTAKTRYLKYDTNYGVMRFEEAATSSEIAVATSFDLYANAANDGTGTWEPKFAMGSNGKVVFSNTSQGSVGDKYLEVNMTDGVKFNTGGAYDAFLLADNVTTANKTFQFPDVAGTLVTTAGAGAHINIGAYDLTADGLVLTNTSEPALIISMTSITGTDNQAIDITGGEALGAEEHWTGIRIKPDDLDPSAADTRIRGLAANLSGVSTTNVPESMEGLRVVMPTGLTGLARAATNAIHITEGDIQHNFSVPATAGELFTVYDMIIDSGSLHANSEIHGFDVSTADGVPSGSIAAIGTHTYVDPIHQHIGTYTTPSQTEYAGEKTGGGVTWVDGVDASEIFVANSDEIYVGSTAGFSEIEVSMTTPGTKTVSPTFWYNTAADTWTQFNPEDATDGFTQSGLIYWSLGDISGSWTNDGDPGGADSSAGYWIKIIRTAAPDPGTPTPTTVKTGTTVLYSWDKTGILAIKDVSGETFTSSDLTSGRITLAGASGVLTDDIDLTFSGAALTLGSDGTDGQLNLFSEQGGTDYTVSLFANTAMTSAASFYLPADEASAESFLKMGTDGIIDYDTTTYLPLSGGTLTGALNIEHTGGIVLGEDIAGGTPNEAGYIKMFSSGDDAMYNTFTAGDNTANATYTLPVAMPASDMFLQSTSAGVMSWEEVIATPQHIMSSMFESSSRVAGALGGSGARTFGSQGVKVETGTTDASYALLNFQDFGEGMNMFDNNPEFIISLKWTGSAGSDGNSRVTLSGQTSLGFALNELGFGFTWDRTNNKFYAASHDGVAEETTDISAYISDGTYYVLRAVEDSGTNVKFYVNGTLRATHTTRVPSGGYPGAYDFFTAIVENEAASSSGDNIKVEMSSLTIKFDY